jgi:hypothetical protein
MPRKPRKHYIEFYEVKPVEQYGETWYAIIRHHERGKEETQWRYAERKGAEDTCRRYMDEEADKRTEAFEVIREQIANGEEPDEIVEHPLYATISLRLPDGRMMF